MAQKMGQRTRIGVKMLGCWSPCGSGNVYSNAILERETQHISNPEQRPSLIPYAKGLEIQTFLAEAVAKGQAPPTLLLLSHRPVYTGGRRMRQQAAQYPSPDLIRRLNSLAEYHETLRGGQLTFHGPGQLIGYPILNLRELKIGVRDYVCQLERTLIRTCGEFGVQAGTTADTGVWVRNGEAKIAALGIHVARYITAHGFALNCDTDLSWFKHIVPCGLPDKQVTSLTQECGKTISISDVIDLLLRALQRELGGGGVECVDMRVLNPELDYILDRMCLS